MRVTVERLRMGLLVGAGLLVLVITGFFGYARYKVRRALVELPGRLGATITKEFNGYTYSQSDGKKTIFTIHASKAVQHTNGTLTLHDVNMILYGHAGHRADRISGDDFEYDTKDEVIRAVGVVHLDLEAPVGDGSRTSLAAKDVGGANTMHEDGAAEGGRVIHVKTSGLVYTKKEGIAKTAEGIEFSFGGFTGHAIGAEYNSETGHLVLQSAITVSGLDARQKNGGRPVAMAASHGELDREKEIAEFTEAHYRAAGQTAEAQAAKIYLRHDGTAERIEGQGQVILESAEQGIVKSDRADAVLDTNSKLRAAVLAGSVHFVENEPLRQAHADADRADITFDEQEHIQHAVLTGRVRSSERLRNPAAAESSERNLTADALELSLAASGVGGKPQLREAKATGSARLDSVAPDAKGGSISTRLAGDTLVAHMVSRGGVTVLSAVHGAGHTMVEQRSGDGGEQKSAGDLLDAAFRDGAKGKGAVELATAIQQGSVVMDRVVPLKKTAATPVAAEVQHATAAKATFDEDSEKLTLSGDVRMRDAESEIAAAKVVLEQNSGNATAEGSVKVSYLQAGSAEPIHVLASRAELNHDAGRATFYSRTATEPQAGLRWSSHGASNAGAGLVRMWKAGTDGQGGSSVEAPVLVIEQKEKRLTARAESADVTGTVHAVLTSAQAANERADRDRTAVGPMPGNTAAEPLRQGVARITSSLLVYSDVQRQAEFTGGVKVLDASGEMRAQEATVYLVAPGGERDPVRNAGASAVPAAAVTSLFGGSVERIVAKHGIAIMQPGRRATGERLVYTANDQMFVLTGTAAAPPRVVDQAEGTTSGASLRFHTGDDSIAVSGTDGEIPAQRVRSETRVQTGKTVKQK